jgi:molybdenum cofactor synthesis domain-containing protein
MPDAPRPAVQASVLTISDRCARGSQRDRSGDLLVQRLGPLPAEIVDRRLVPDDAQEIAASVQALAARSRLLVTTGGTGLGPRDITPESIRPLLEREIPGMGEAMRAAGLISTSHAMLSRQFAGTRDRCLVLVLPGSTRAVDECLTAVWAALPHALELLSGRQPWHALADG